MTTSDPRRRIADNVAAVRARIAAAAAKSGRTADAVTLVAVTKYVPLPVAAALVEAGCHDLGESRPQELWAKAAALSTGDVSPVVPPPSPLVGEGVRRRRTGEGLPFASDSLHTVGATRPPHGIRWHLVGHLQRNKIRRTLPLVHLLHSIDSQRLLVAVNEEASHLGLHVAALVEVNISGDSTKTGLPPDELAPLLHSASALPHVSIRGLMGMASLEGGLAAAQRDFARLRQLRDEATKDLPAGVSLTELSMGMSDDFEVAIAEGATIVRLGSALVEGVVDTP